MPIPITCPSCNGQFNAPDSAAGKKGKCPSCGGIIPIPMAAPKEQIYEAEDAGPRPFDDSDFDEPAPAAAPETGGGDRKPCPMCGEMIAREAVKCRYCGEVFDPVLRKKARKSQASSDDSDLTPVDWVLCILCGTIGCIVGLVYMIQGKPKGGKMILVAICAGVIWGVINVLLRVALENQ